MALTESVAEMESVDIMNGIDIPVIGLIRSPFKELKNMPIQPPGAKGKKGTLVLYDEYASGLKALDGFSHIYIFYHFHKAPAPKMEVVPFMDNTPKGIFATRSPLRPSGLGMSVVELVSVSNNVVTISGIDVLDETPLIDIRAERQADHPVRREGCGGDRVQRPHNGGLRRPQTGHKAGQEDGRRVRDEQEARPDQPGARARRCLSRRGDRQEQRTLRRPVGFGGQRDPQSDHRILREGEGNPQPASLHARPLGERSVGEGDHRR